MEIDIYEPTRSCTCRSPIPSWRSRSVSPASMRRWPVTAPATTPEAFTAVADLQAGSAGVNCSGGRMRPPTGSAHFGLGPSASTGRHLPAATPVSTPRLLRHPEAASERYDIDVRTILQEVGRRALVGGLEVLIVDIVPDLVSTGSEG